MVDPKRKHLKPVHALVVRLPWPQHIEGRPEQLKIRGTAEYAKNRGGVTGGQILDINQRQAAQRDGDMMTGAVVSPGEAGGD
jgi:hypothetical protein